MPKRRMKGIQIQNIGAGQVVKAVADVAKTTIATAAITQTTGTAVTQISALAKWL